MPSARSFASSSSSTTTRTAGGKPSSVRPGARISNRPNSNTANDVAGSSVQAASPAKKPETMNLQIARSPFQIASAGTSANKQAQAATVWLFSVMANDDMNVANAAETNAKNRPQSVVPSRSSSPPKSHQ